MTPVSPRPILFFGSPVEKAMIILDGRKLAKLRREKLGVRAREFKSRFGRPPGLAVILVGQDPASQIYVGNKVKACQKVGICSLEKHFPRSTSQGELNDFIEELNGNGAIDGILVQFPLPEQLSRAEVLGRIDPKKDSDGLTYENLGWLFSGETSLAPCTPSGIMKLLEHYEIPLSGKSAVVVGRSSIVGKPMAHLLTEANATVSLCHSKTSSVKSYTQQADLVVVAAGRPRLFGREDFKRGAVVVDVGIHRSQGGPRAGPLCGDVRWEELETHVRAASPVPGGVGPMTIQMLLENTLFLAEARQEGRGLDLRQKNILK